VEERGFVILGDEVVLVAIVVEHDPSVGIEPAARFTGVGIGADGRKVCAAPSVWTCLARRRSGRFLAGAVEFGQIWGLGWRCRAGRAVAGRAVAGSGRGLE